MELPAIVETGLQETIIVNVRRSQGFQVLFGDISYRVNVPTERIQLWLLREQKVIRISPMTSPAELGIVDGAKMRVRIRGIMARQAPPSPTPSTFPISWNDSFLKVPGVPRGPTLPTSPSFGRSRATTISSPPRPKEVHRPSKIDARKTVDVVRNLNQWQFGHPFEN